MESRFKQDIESALSRFINWIENYGEKSYDQYDFWASTYGQKSKSLYYRSPILGKIAVAPLVMMDSFIPGIRKFFRKKTRFPIADAHFSMAFSYLYKLTGEENYRQKARHFLDALIKTRCPDYKYFCWGYPFSWSTINGLFHEGTPLITSTPYAYEAFSLFRDITGDESLDTIMHSIAEHAIHDLTDTVVGENSSACSYSPVDHTMVVNANSYRSLLLFLASVRFNNKEYRKIAEGNLNFVLESQQPDGSWFYSMDGNGNFIDNFHTCFVMKNIIKIEQLTGIGACSDAIDRGAKFYLDKLIDEENLPKPFAIAPRTVLHKRELYDYAESINLAILLKDRIPRFRDVLEAELGDLFKRWQKKDGSFRTRQLVFGWNNTPYLRWAQSQLFRSFAFFLVHSQSVE